MGGRRKAAACHWWQQCGQGSGNHTQIHTLAHVASFFFFSRFLHMEAILITNNILPLLLSVFQQLSIIRAASASHFLQGSSGEPFRQGQTPQGSSGIFSTEISFRNDRVVNTAATWVFRLVRNIPATAEHGACFNNVFDSIIFLMCLFLSRKV